MITDPCVQGTDEWFEKRLGNPGASNFGKIVTTKGELSKQSTKYMYTLAAEIISGQHAPGYSNANMERGIEKEDESRSRYELTHDCEVTQVGLCWPDESKMYHCSPDGLILDQRIGFETKDAIGSVQVERLLKNKMPTEHYAQVQGSLLITGYDAWDFQSYCSEQPGLPVLTIRVYPDDKFMKALAAALESFCIELAMTIKRLKEM